MYQMLSFFALSFPFPVSYSPETVGHYIQSADLHLCVGEYWDDCNYIGDNYEFAYDQGRCCW